MYCIVLYYMVLYTYIAFMLHIYIAKYLLLPFNGTGERYRTLGSTKAGNMILFDVGGSDFGRCELAAAAKEHCCLIPSKVYGSSTIKFAFITYSIS